MPAIYTAIATTNGGGRQGHAETSDGQVKLDLGYPKEMGGSGAGTNPEQLVSLGYSACFGGALAVAARSKKIDIEDATVVCRTTLHKDGDAYSLSFEIEVDLPTLSQPEADALVAEAHKICPYSRAFGSGAPTSARATAAF